ncbi:hypothetical protein VET2_18260 [Escherichia coli]|nr:hypothetical protein VET10_18300 [Escherichia coli]BEG39282.1 hypothetical protein VET2_18260 [Escherichia coli]
MKSCEGIPITTFGVISGILVILFENLDIEENGMTADKDAIVLKNNLLFTLKPCNMNKIIILQQTRILINRHMLYAFNASLKNNKYYFYSYRP